MFTCVVTLARDPYHKAPSLRLRPPDPGHSPNRAFFAWRSATRSNRSTAWPGDAGPSLLAFRRPTAFMGFISRPSQVWSRGRVDSSRRLKAAAWQAASSRRPTCRLGISAGPGPRVVRASASAPIDFRRGDRSPVGGNEICKSDRPGMRMASTSGLRLPSAVHPPGARSARRMILPWALPLAGLSGTLPCIAPGSTPRAITSLRMCRRTSPPTRPIRSWAFATLRSITHILPATLRHRPWRS
jgi:hypothetical protein